MLCRSRPCRCGSAYHRIKNIGGRSEDFLYFKLAEGKTGFIHPSEIVEFFVPGLEKYVKFTTECVKEIPLDGKTGKFRLIIPYNHQAGTDE